MQTYYIIVVISVNDRDLLEDLRDSREYENSKIFIAEILETERNENEILHFHDFEFLYSILEVKK